MSIATPPSFSFLTGHDPLFVEFACAAERAFSNGENIVAALLTKTKAERAALKPQRWSR